MTFERFAENNGIIIDIIYEPDWVTSRTTNIAAYKVVDGARRIAEIDVWVAVCEGDVLQKTKFHVSRSNTHPNSAYVVKYEYRIEKDAIHFFPVDGDTFIIEDEQEARAYVQKYTKELAEQIVEAHKLCGF